MTIQTELRRIWRRGRYARALAEDECLSLESAIASIDKLEAENNRLKRRVNELADLVSGCGLTAEIAAQEGIHTEPEE